MTASAPRRDTEWTDRSILLAIPQRPAALVRISEDPLNLEKGVTRQWEDALRIQTQLGWCGTLLRIEENDTSAYKRRWVTLPDGTRQKRVIRPDFDNMIARIYAGEIDGLIVYDLDRLVRQNRQLEDLIDAVEHMAIPVHSASGGSVNLLTADGRANARMMCTMALKQSDDTSRRVARAAFSSAKEGSLTRGGPRRFGWEPDGLTLREAEADALRTVIARAIDGESLWSLCLWLHDQKVAPVDPPRKKRTQSSGKFNRTSLNQLLRSPRLAGIRSYAGVGRGQRVRINDWQNRTMIKGGEYVMGPWTPIITVQVWEALQHALDAPARKNGGGQKSGGHNARKYLLTSLLRCGNCGSKMVGRPAVPNRRGATYQCLPKDQGGCNGVSRNMERVDNFVVTLLMAHLELEAMHGVKNDRTPEELKAAHEAIARIETSKTTARTRWKEGKTPDADYYADIDALNEELNTATAIVAERQKRSGRKITQNPRGGWELMNLSQRQALLCETFTHITIMPQAQKGRWGWRDEDIRPVWTTEDAGSDQPSSPSSEELQPSI